MKIDDIQINLHKTVVAYPRQPKRTLFYATFWLDGFHQTYSFSTKKEALQAVQNEIKALK